jgi:uncharacterized SAM-binding protein YcdF (DUF218 family)
MNNREQYLQLYQKLLEQAPEPAEVLVWLQGDSFDRGQKVLELYHQQFANLILLTGNNDSVGPHAKSGEDGVSLFAMRQWLVDKGVPADKITLDDKSFNTKDQSINVVKLTIAEKWQKIIVVSSSYYQPRAFLTFIKAAVVLGYQGKIISQAVFIDLAAVPGGRSDTAGNLLKLEAAKTEDYQTKGDAAGYNDGFKYLLCQ